MQPRHDEEFDIIVIGGGPGGSTVGTLLASFGKRVLIIEKEVFPRYHIGESLLSGTASLMKKLNVLEKIEAAGAVRKYGVQWIWGQSREPWTVYFKDALAMPYDFGYQVERATFDKVLLDNAGDHGVDVRQGCRVVEVLRDGDRVTGLVYEEPGGERRTVKARWTVDATGQGGYISRQMHERTWDPVLRNMAVWSYWKGVKLPEGIDRGNTVLTTFPDGWLWFIPLHGDVISIGAVLDRDAYLRVRADGVNELYHNAIAAAPELAERLKDAECVSEVKVQKDWSYSYDKFWGKGYVAVGDAACFIDPLLSTGVHLAMLSGYLAAVTLNTILDKPDSPAESLLDFYEGTYKREVERLKMQIYFLYGGQKDKESQFWKARDQFNVPEIKPEQAFISLIAGAWEHRSWYNRYLKNLEVPSHLRDVLNGAFEAKSIGPEAIGLDTPVASTGRWSIVDDFGVDGQYLCPAKSLRVDDGTTLALTPMIRKLLDAADGKRSIAELADVVAAGASSREEVVSTLHKIISYGVLAPAS
ncbi:FAD-dependent oxidoreductase [Sorangium sp. So ce1151]|uniref:FAD-dependent oxidoreductase n=1 Tax=Sorangium sp. So ce1151 TaxID=3133332 RepID=UPI003F5F28AD